MKFTKIPADKILRNLTYTFLIFILIYIFSLPYLGRLEGMFFPPMTNMSLSIVDQESPNRLVLGGGAKLERECIQTDMDFQFTYGSTSVAVPWERVTATRAQSVGSIYWGPWVLNLNEHQLSYGDLDVYVSFTCHPFYETIVRFSIDDLLDRM